MFIYWCTYTKNRVEKPGWKTKLENQVAKPSWKTWLGTQVHLGIIQVVPNYNIRMDLICMICMSNDVN